MLKFLYADELDDHYQLSTSMFQDRTQQFHNRLKWDVCVDHKGEERDEYDSLNPLYVIWERDDGLHGGSMRFLPTMGRCMVNEHFSHLLDGREIKSPDVWECTRFCLNADASRSIAAVLMLAGGELMRAFGIAKFVGVFDQRMTRIYRRIGASPYVLASTGLGREQVNVGLWSFCEQTMTTVSKTAGLSNGESRKWLEAAATYRMLNCNQAA